MTAPVSRLAGFGLLLLAAMAAFAQQNPITTNGSQVSFSGYVQPRLTITNGETGAGPSDVPTNFDTKRVYLIFGARLDPRVSGRVILTGVPQFGVLEAFGSYTFSPTTEARAGIVGIPYGYEAGLSSSRLITTERSRAIQDKVYREWSFDRGALVNYTPRGQAVGVSAGLVNGTPMVAGVPGGAADANDTKNFVGRASYPVRGGSVGVSLYDGKTPGNATLNRYGVDLRTTVVGDRCTRTIIGEALVAKDGATKSNGAYLTLARQARGSNVQPYVRFDVYDPNTAAGNDYYTRWTLGANRFLSRVNPLTKFQLEYEIIDDSADPRLDSRITAQYQVGF